MQFLLSGPLVSRAYLADVEQEDGNVDDSWVCYVCETKNSCADLDEKERCIRCKRLRYPLWLLVEQGNFQLELGSCVRLHDDESFGTKVAIVSGIDFYKRRIQVLSVCSKIPYQRPTSEQIQEDTRSAQEQRSKFIFNLSEMDHTQIQQLKRINNDDDAANELLGTLKQHGLCKDCRRVFRIVQGAIQEEESSRDAIRALESELHKWLERKAQNLKLKENDRVLACTDQVKSLTIQLSKVRRTVEFLAPLCCPYCGWNAS